MIGANLVSSSRSTTPAISATTMKVAKIAMIPITCRIANGALTWTLPRDPIWIWSTVTDPKVSRKKIRQPIQKTGLFSW
jgi:hypothetical protein